VIVARPTLGTLEFGLERDSRLRDGEREKEVRRGATEKERRRMLPGCGGVGSATYDRGRWPPVSVA